MRAARAARSDSRRASTDWKTATLPPATAATRKTTAPASSSRSRRFVRRIRSALGLARRLALREERALELVQLGVVLASPVERARKPGAAVQLGRVTVRVLPFLGRPDDVSVEPAAFRVLLQPLAQPRPLAEQRLVGDLERLLAHSHETAVGENRHDASSILVRLELELRERRAAADGVVAVDARQPQEDPAGGLRCSGVKPSYASSAIRATAPRTPPLSRYVSSRQRPTVTVLPELDERRGEQGQPARLVDDVGDEGVHERGLDVQAGAARGQLDRAPQVVRLHRADEDVVLRELGGERGEGRKAAVEVGPDGDDDRLVRRGTRERVEEDHALGLVAAEREDLLELIDDEQELRAAHGRAAH